jgi:hypothetical protein
MLDKVQNQITSNQLKGWATLRFRIAFLSGTMSHCKNVAWRSENIRPLGRNANKKTEKLSRWLHEPRPSKLPSSFPNCTTYMLVTTPPHCLAGYCQNQECLSMWWGSNRSSDKHCVLLKATLRPKQQTQKKSTRTLKDQPQIKKNPRRSSIVQA